ncbi:MAG: DNA helicase RecG, partial [Chloroflexi bacterium]|nr:DNA helicase RecG [Chloroflexota bacterium]
RMPSKDKERIMRSFKERQVDLLVSTAVIEVGIDVPNASIMLIEGAERFGLSQLHQLRGRVGRGGLPSYCLLLAESPSAESMERLGIVERTSDGFTLADEDLRLRGPGEFLGTRQHGLPDLRMARLSDVPLLEFAREQAAALFAEDPDLARPEHQALRRELERLWPQGLAEMS